MRNQAWHVILRFIDKLASTLFYLFIFWHEESELVAVLITYPSIKVAILTGHTDSVKLVDRSGIANEFAPYGQSSPNADTARCISRKFLPLPQHDASDACEVGDGVYLGIAVFL